MGLLSRVFSYWRWVSLSVNCPLTCTVADMIVSLFQRLYKRWTTKAPREALLANLAEARYFEEWEAAAYKLDEVLGYDLW